MLRSSARSIPAYRISVFRTAPGWTAYLDLAGPAVGVLIVGFAEGLGAAKTYAAKAGYQISANRELIGLVPPTSGPGCAPGWWSTEACPRPR